MNNYVSVLSRRILTAIAVVMVFAGGSTVATAEAPSDLLLVLDNSGSMRKNDPGFLATKAIRSFVEGIQGDTRAGVIIFDHNVRLVVPLQDVDSSAKTALSASLDEINYRGQLTDSPAAVERAIYELKTNGRPDAKKIIIFMTDGIVDTGNPAADVEKTKWLREELAVDAADNDIKVYAIAFTENADFFLIQSLAKKSGGEYFRALTADGLGSVFAEVENRISADRAPVAAPAAPTATQLPAAQDSEPPITARLVEPEVVPELIAPPQEAAPPSEFDADNPLAGLSEEDLAALREISEMEGIPVEQLARELLGDEPIANGESGVVITRPGEPSVVIEEPSSANIPLLIGALGILLALVGIIVWFFKQRTDSAAAAEQSRDSGSTLSPGEVIPAAFLHDVSGFAEQALTNLTDKPLMVGRTAGNENQHLDYLIVNVPTVGRRHAVLKYKDHAFWLVDQGSVNGTFVNDERVSGERRLRHGDRIKFHSAEFEFTQPDAADGVDAGETIIGDSALSEATIVADSNTIARAVSAATAAVPPLEAAASGTDAAAEDGTDMFDAGGAEDPGDITMEDSISDELEALENANASLDDQGDVTDIFDVTGEGSIPPVGGQASDMDADAAGLFETDFTDTGPGITPAGGEPAAEIDEEFNAEASAFFDDITVGAVSVADGGPSMDVSGDGDDLFTDTDDGMGSTDGMDQDDLDAKLEKARAIMDGEDPLDMTSGDPLDTTSGGGLDATTGDFNELATMVHDDLTDLEEPEDVTLNRFIETDSFDAPKTEPPRTPMDEEVSLDDFVDTAMIDPDKAKSLSNQETVILDQNQLPDEPNVNDTVVLPGRESIKGDKDEDDDEEDNGSEDPTVLKP